MLYAIILTTFLQSPGYHTSYGGVSIVTVGEYKTVEQCEHIAGQLRSSNSNGKVQTTARCVAIR